MSVWSILGIDPTDEPRKIKRAYSKRIASCHPEDDPEGFQRLQQAYEQALSYAKGELDLEDLEGAEELEAPEEPEGAEELEGTEGLLPFADQLEQELSSSLRAGEEFSSGEALSNDDPLGEGAFGESFNADDEEDGEEGFSVSPGPDPQTKPLENINWRAQRDVFAGFTPEDSGNLRGKRQNAGRQGGGRSHEEPPVMFGAPNEAREHVAARIAERRRSQEEHREETPENLAFIKDFIQDENSKEQKRLQKMEFHLEELEELVARNGDLISFFNLGIYARYQDIPGFEERLAEIIEDYVQQMNIVEMAELQEAIGYDEDGTGPLVTLFDSRYESTSPLSFVKGILSFIKNA